MKWLALSLVWLLLQGMSWADPAPGIEHQTSFLVNKLRAAHNLKPLVVDARLTELAREHSQDMLDSSYFGHGTGDNTCSGLRERLKKSRVHSLQVGENLHKIAGVEASEVATDTLNSWSDSPPHLKNLLHPRYNRVGVGVIRRRGLFIVTQILCFQPIQLNRCDWSPEGTGFRVRLEGTVLEGSSQGAVFFDDRRIANWNADPAGHFSVDFFLPRAGTLGLAQPLGGGEWSIDTEFEVKRQ
jgi:hypothetical protein